jgi:hypothetical protein
MGMPPRTALSICITLLLLHLSWSANLAATPPLAPALALHLLSQIQPDILQCTITLHHAFVPSIAADDMLGLR